MRRARRYRRESSSTSAMKRSEFFRSLATWTTLPVRALSAPATYRDVPLHVLAWGEDDELLPAAHVGRPNARVEIDVGLVDIEEFALGTGALHQAIDLAEDFSPAAHRDAQSDARPPAPDVVREEQVASVARAEEHARVLNELRREKLQAPRRALPAEVLRGAIDVADELGFDGAGDLLRRPVRPAVEEPALAEILEAVDGPVHGGAGAPRDDGTSDGSSPPWSSAGSGRGCASILLRVFWRSLFIRRRCPRSIRRLMVIEGDLLGLGAVWRLHS